MRVIRIVETTEDDSPINRRFLELLERLGVLQIHSVPRDLDSKSQDLTLNCFDLLPPKDCIHSETQKHWLDAVLAQAKALGFNATMAPSWSKEIEVRSEESNEPRW